MEEEEEEESNSRHGTNAQGDCFIMPEAPRVT